MEELGGCVSLNQEIPPSWCAGGTLGALSISCSPPVLQAEIKGNTPQKPFPGFRTDVPSCQ